MCVCVTIMAWEQLGVCVQLTPLEKTEGSGHFEPISSPRLLLFFTLSFYPSSSSSSSQFGPSSFSYQHPNPVCSCVMEAQAERDTAEEGNSNRVREI